MADRDWYDNNIRKNWRGVARRIEKGGDPARIGELALRALAKTLRESAGVPGLDEMIECARNWSDGETIRQAFANLREESRRAGGSAVTQVAAVAAQSTIVAVYRGSFQDGYQRVANQHQCGRCASDLLRRQALFSSGLDRFDPSDGYVHDVTKALVEARCDELTWLRLMHGQVNAFASYLKAPDPWSALVDAFPSLMELQIRRGDWQSVGGTRSPEVAIPALLQSYVEEWKQFPVPV